MHTQIQRHVTLFPQVKKKKVGAGKVAQQFSVLLRLPGDAVQFPAHMVVLQLSLTPAPGTRRPLFLQIPDIHADKTTPMFKKNFFLIYFLVLFFKTGSLWSQALPELTL